MGYRFFRSRKKFIACLLLFNMLLGILYPLSAFALTSGPAQPEAMSFQPAGVSDMVDLFSGDFKYNIPLIDIEGYPINLNYQSGVGMEDEASWVGLGWNLNLGSVTRQLRGVPDDFKGDSVTTVHDTKAKVTVGGRATAKVEFGGKAKLGGSFNFGIFSDNYTGIGAELGVNAGISFSLANSGMMTSSLGIGVMSSTSSGVDITPNISLAIKENAISKHLSSASFSSSLGYNSRSGMKSLTLGASYGQFSSSVSNSFNTEPIYPKIQIPYFSDYGSFSIDVGAAAFGVFTGIGGTGYVSKRYVKGSPFVNPQYGFLYADAGKDVKKAVQDFIREKENPVVNELPNLALPVHTPDIFNYTSQKSAGQFRLYRNGTGSFFDNEVEDGSKVETFGIDIGGGAIAHGGVTYFNQNARTTTKKWTGDNAYLRYGDFQSANASDLKQEHVYFRRTDEKSKADPAGLNRLKGTDPVLVEINGANANSAFKAGTSLVSVAIDSLIINKQRARRGTSISYLTAEEAALGGLDKNIYTSSFLYPGSAGLENIESSQRVGGDRKKHHISEITVTEGDGGRAVYGIPVYNHKQEEYSFAIGRKDKDYKLYRNLAKLKVSGNLPAYKNGIDQYYHKEIQPAYAVNYLLTGLLSPDYMDKTGDGISPDDLGTAIKFNYSKIGNYRWRTPYRANLGGSEENTVAVNRGLLADPDDDKGSIVYGEKEIYYPRTIESRNYRLVFVTDDRKDALGVTNWEGNIDESIKQKCLKEIRLYSKGETERLIKTVKFDYDYSLCLKTPNTIVGQTPPFNTLKGKLTLKKVWFEYGDSPKGANHPYVFTYSTNNPDYKSASSDRWGTFKSATNPHLPGDTLTNEEYPYTIQDLTSANAAASIYRLTKIGLPSGGEISVTYESDDYAYVQNRRAAVMSPIVGLGTIGANSGLVDGTGIIINIDSLPPAQVDTLQWYKNTYLDGSNYVFTKLYTRIGTDEKLSKGQNYDYVSTYCKLKGVRISGTAATLYFESIVDNGKASHPIRRSAWQKMKNEYPRYAYPGFLNAVEDKSLGANLEASVTAVFNAAKNITELKENFFEKAKRKNYANEVVLHKSFVRISRISGFKLGGGSRVKQIAISDEWTNFGGAGSSKATYGQSYDYTVRENGKVISSGVASYEPAVGSDENPFRQPVFYAQNIKGAVTNYFELEEPFGESYFPSASVGYSKVTVRDLDASGNVDLSPLTGSVVNEFYTAREFPVQVTVLPIQKQIPRKKHSYSLVATSSFEEQILSQGYMIELNDMHGKVKATRVFNKAGAEISSNVYQYLVQDPTAKELRLKNEVEVINNDGKVSHNAIVGRDIELFTDFREQESSNTGRTLNAGLDIIPFFIIPLIIPHWPSGGNDEYKRFRSVCAVKVVQNQGILSKVVKTDNGSSNTTENVAFDHLTGDAVVTRTQNEFNDYYYSTNVPAYWVNNEMGGAYQNIGIFLDKILFDTQGRILSPANLILQEGDQLMSLSNVKRYWIRGKTDKYLVNDKGEMVKTVLSDEHFKIVRSGFTNQLQAAAATMVSQANPIQNDTLVLTSSQDIASSMKVLSASVTLYNDVWSLKPDCNLPLFQKVENTDYCFKFSHGDMNQAYSHLGTKIKQFPTSSEVTITSRYWGGVNCSTANGRMAKSSVDTTSLKTAKVQKSAAIANLASTPCGGVIREVSYDSYTCWPLNRAGIWFDKPSQDYMDLWGGFEKCVTFEESKYYYFGYGADNQMQILIDDNEFVNQEFNSEDNYFYWHVTPKFITKGTHRIKVRFKNVGAAQPGNYASVGLEIYNNTFDQLNVSNPTPTVLFTTSSMINQDVDSFREIGGNINIYHWTYADGTVFSSCGGMPSYQINPFLHGLKGNWRPSETKVYQGSRGYDNLFTAGTRGINLQNAGFLTQFKSYWTFSALEGWVANTSNPFWITTNTVTLYDERGQETENKDALGRYSAAKFTYGGGIPAVVAANAMNREVYFCDFENLSKLDTSCNSKEFRWRSSTGSPPMITALGHSGLKSASIPLTGVELSTQRHTGYHRSNTPLFGLTGKGDYFLAGNNGLFPYGFEPLPTGKYLFTAWINDNNAPTVVNRSVGLALGVKGETGGFQTVPLSCKAVVERWKLVEGVIDMAAYPGSGLTLKMTSGLYNMLIDDIRIQPVKGRMKTYVYNPETLKLMAELDEQAMATFYEYDEQGSLVRVKKETERGILTIKENRSSYRKKQI